MCLKGHFGYLILTILQSHTILLRKFLQTVVYCAVNVPHYQEPQKYDICVFVAWKV